jgi:hypothetical protein
MKPRLGPSIYPHSDKALQNRMLSIRALRFVTTAVPIEVGALGVLFFALLCLLVPWLASHPLNLDLFLSCHGQSRLSRKPFMAGCMYMTWLSLQIGGLWHALVYGIYISRTEA